MNIKQIKIRESLNDPKIAIAFMTICILAIVLIFSIGKESKKNDYLGHSEILLTKNDTNTNHNFTEITSFSFRSVNPFFMHYVKNEKKQVLIDGIDLDELNLDMIMIKKHKSYAIVNDVKLMVGSSYNKYIVNKITRKGIELKDRMGNIFFISMY